MLIIGIDPGVSGAVGLLNSLGHYLCVYDIPTVLANKSSNRQMVSPVDLANLLREIVAEEKGGSVVAITENVGAMPGQANISMFAFGKSLGILFGVLAALEIPTHIVSPVKWKKHFYLGKEKGQSRELAQRMWPTAPLGLKKHHNRAESLLLAKYYVDTSSQLMVKKRPRILSLL